jgi:hypothetical protein
VCAPIIVVSITMLETRALPFPFLSGVAGVATFSVAFTFLIFALNVAAVAAALRVVFVLISLCFLGETRVGSFLRAGELALLGIMSEGAGVCSRRESSLARRGLSPVVSPGLKML